MKLNYYDKNGKELTEGNQVRILKGTMMFGKVLTQDKVITLKWDEAYNTDRHLWNIGEEGTRLINVELLTN